MKTTLLLLALAGVLSGCVERTLLLRRQVAFDEKCPIENVRLVEWGPGQLSADVSACGKPLTYHNAPVMTEHSSYDNWSRVEVK